MALLLDRGEQRVREHQQQAHGDADDGDGVEQAEADGGAERGEAEDDADGQGRAGLDLGDELNGVLLTPSCCVVENV